MCPTVTSRGFAYLNWGRNGKSLKVKASQHRLGFGADLLGILLIALKGLKTLIVLIAVKFKFSTCKKYSKAPDITMKKSKRFHESAR